MAFSHHYQGSIDSNTVNIHRNVGMYSLAIGMILNDMIIRDRIIPYTPCSPGNVRGNTVPRGSIDPYTPRTPGPGAGSVLDIMISEDHVIQYHPCC